MLAFCGSIFATHVFSRAMHGDVKAVRLGGYLIVFYISATGKASRKNIEILHTYVMRSSALLCSQQLLTCTWRARPPRKRPQLAELAPRLPVLLEARTSRAFRQNDAQRAAWRAEMRPSRRWVWHPPRREHGRPSRRRDTARTAVKL